jgi:hypothetical protein
MRDAARNASSASDCGRLVAKMMKTLNGISNLRPVCSVRIDAAFERHDPAVQSRAAESAAAKSSAAKRRRWPSSGSAPRGTAIGLNVSRHVERRLAADDHHQRGSVQRRSCAAPALTLSEAPVVDVRRP